jgi:MoxR-like ATPase
MAVKQIKGQETLQNILAEISKVVIGKDDIKELLLVALLSKGHVLIEGTPGTAKTTTARTFAHTIGGEFKRVQGTPDMLPSDILGFFLYRTDGSSTFIPGPIFANVLLADELNRTTPRTQAALLEAMQENQVTIERETYHLEQPFIVIGSQIPYGGPGTSPLSDVQKDRFMFRLWSEILNREEEDLVLKNIDVISEPDIAAVTTPEEIVRFQEEVKKIYVADSIRHYILKIVDRLRNHQDILAGPSTRAGIALLKASRSLAFIHGREFVIPDDVKKLIIPVLSHRLQMTAEAEMEDITPERVIKEVSLMVPVPKMDHE